jgi:hypothetical protein
MLRRPLAILGVAAALVSSWPASASAGHFFHRAGCEHEERPHPTPDPGEKRQFCHTHERAGNPLCLREHLQPTDAGDSYGYYVGGGGGHGSGPRCREEGTFGWDYTGIHFPRRVLLGWSHGRKFQGGTGYYGTNDPVEVKNVFAIEPPRLHHKGE